MHRLELSHGGPTTDTVSPGHQSTDVHTIMHNIATARVPPFPVIATIVPICCYVSFSLLQVVGLKIPERDGYLALQVGAGYRPQKGLSPQVAGMYLAQV